MNWPWVSRLALDAVLSERDRLRELNDKLVDSIIRIQRKEIGLPEIQPEKRQPVEPLPQAVIGLINAWDDPLIRADMEKQARAVYRQSKDWNAVIEALQVQ